MLRSVQGNNQEETPGPERKSSQDIRYSIYAEVRLSLHIRLTKE